MGEGSGNFSYDALNEFRQRTGFQPYLRDTSIAYAGPGAAYNNSKIDNFGAAGWRLFRIRVDDP